MQAGSTKRNWLPGTGKKPEVEGTRGHRRDSRLVVEANTDAKQGRRSLRGFVPYLGVIVGARLESTACRVLCVRF
jgi:hypothetical protein